MKKFSRRVSFPSLRSSPSKKSLNIDEIPKSSSENIYSGITHIRSSSSPDKKSDSFVNGSPEKDRPISLFCEAFDDIKFTSPLSMAEDDGISVLESSEEVILPPPTGFGDDAASVSSNHDYEEIPHDVVLEPYLATLHLKSPSISSSQGAAVEEFDPDSCVPPVICGDQSLLDEIEACRREAFGAMAASPNVRNSILNEFDPLRKASARDGEDEPYYATVKAAKSLEKAMSASPISPPVDFSTMPRDSVYSSYSDSSSSGFEDSVALKESLPKFDDATGFGDGFQLAGFKLCSSIDPSVACSMVPIEGYLYQFNDDKKDFTRLWCTLKDGMFNPFAGPLPSKARVGRKWCLETRFITTICGIERGSLGITQQPDVRSRKSLLLNGASKIGYCDFDSSDGSDLSFFEISSLYDASQQQGKKVERRILGALLDSDCMLWCLSLLRGVAPPKCLDQLEERFPEFSIVGSVYYKENISGSWQTGWLLLSGYEVYLESIEEGQVQEIDLRKVRSVTLKPVEDARNAIGVYDKGTVFVLTLARSTLYFQSVMLKDTKNWHSRLSAVWESCGKGPELERFFLTQDNVPIIVDKCIKFVTTHGFGAEGIYRKSASNAKTADVLEKLRRDPWGTILTNEDYTEHDVANALKRFFRTLPQPLMTDEFGHLWIAYAGVQDLEKKLDGYDKLLLEMPEVHKCTLKQLIWHLHTIDSQHDKNSMPAKNLAPIWGPTLMTVEGANSEKHGGFAQTSEESDVVFDLITHFSRLFGVGDDELAKEADIITALGKLREGPRLPRQSGDMRVWVYLHDAKFGSSVSITVTPTLTSGDLCAQFVREGKLKGRLSEFSVFEVLFDGNLERPLHHTEKILQTILQWTCWDDPYRARNVLVLKKNDLYPKIAQYQALQPLSNLSELDYADRKMKSFRSFVFDFSNAILHCYKDDKDAQNQNGTPLHEWKIEDIIWYLGAESKRGPPHKWAITFVEKDAVIKKTRDQKWFGNTLAFRHEDLMLRWLSSFLYSKHRSGIVMLTPPEDDLLQ